MPKIIMTKGLPASGKTTWAKAQVKKGGVTRVNKDDLRAMLHGRWSKSNEKIVLNISDSIIAVGLEAGHNVIVDDTNLSDTHYARIKSKFPGIPIEVKEFDVSVDEAIRRDLMRERTVGSKVIRGMHAQFIRESEREHYDHGDTPAIIVDIDGTLAHMIDRGPYELDKVGTDKFDEIVSKVVDSFRDTHKIILLSGREDSAKGLTIEWLKANGFEYDHLFMRKAGDMRKDYVVKKELFMDNVAPDYDVALVLDDRPQVIRMWQSELSLKVMACNNDYDNDF